MFTTVLQVLVLGTIIAQSIVCVVVQSVTVGMTKVEKLSLVHVEVNVGSNEKENVTVVARLCSLAKRRDSVMYCPGKPLLSRAWLRDGGIGFELGMDEQDITDMIKERTGYVNFRGLEHLHESAFAEFWPPCTLAAYAIDLVTPSARVKGGRIEVLDFDSMADQYDAHMSGDGIYVCEQSPYELSKATKHLLLESGKSMDELEELDMRLGRARLESDDGQHDGACTSKQGSILLNLRCRYEWATLRPSDDQLKFIEDLHGCLCATLGVRGTTGGAWDHANTFAECTQNSAIKILSVRRGPDPDIIKQCIEFVKELVMFILRKFRLVYILFRYWPARRRRLRQVHNAIIDFRGSDEHDIKGFHKGLDAKSQPVKDWVQAFDPTNSLVYFYNAEANETRVFNPNNPFVRCCCHVGRKSAVVGRAVAGKSVEISRLAATTSVRATRFAYDTTLTGVRRLFPAGEPRSDAEAGGGAANDGSREREYHDGEGTFNPLFKSAQRGESAVDMLFAQVDADGSGQIHFEEFCKWWESRVGSAEAAREIFAELDEDGSGMLDDVEFKMILTELATADWVAAKDEATGRAYYVNLKTRVTRWTPPGDAEVDEWLADTLAKMPAAAAAAGGGGGGAARARTDVSQIAVSGEMSADALFDAVDIDGSGGVSFAELAEWWQSRQAAIGKADDSLSRAEQVFAELDEDGSGMLDRLEFKAILTEVVMGEWVAAQDDVSGRPYYVNKQTRETRWTPPGDAEVDDWLDAHLGGDAPEHADGAALMSPDGLFDLVDVDHSGDIQFSEFTKWWRMRQAAIGKSDDGAMAKAQKIFNELDEDSSGHLDRMEFKGIIQELAASDWVAARDEASGRAYYVNLKTRATRWVPPGDAEVEEWLAERLAPNPAAGKAAGGKPAAAPAAAGRPAAVAPQPAPQPAPEPAPQQGPEEGDTSTIDELFEALDTEGKGELSFDAFSAWWSRANAADVAKLAQAREIFDDLDEDGSGTLDSFEFEAVILELASEDWIAAQDPATGRTYHVHKATKTTRWEEPGVEEAEEWLADHTGWIGSEAV